jgi:hypothetical protein
MREGGGVGVLGKCEVDEGGEGEEGRRRKLEFC